MSEKPEVDGKDLIERAFASVFNRLGDVIHGATTKEKGKAAKDDDKTKAAIETTGEESRTAPSSEAPSSQEKRA